MSKPPPTSRLGRRGITKPPTHVRDVIESALRHGFAERLRFEGYKRSGHTWRLSDDAGVRLVQVQASAWGTADQGSFTINLGIYDYRLQSLLEGSGDWPPRRGKQPVEYNCAIRTRIGSLMGLPGGRVDYWWDVSLGTDLAMLGRELAEVLERHALPWLSKARDYRYAMRHSNYGPGSLPGEAMQKLLGREKTKGAT